MRNRRWLIPALVGAIIINVGMLALATLLTHEETDKKQDLTALTPLSLLMVDPVEPPAEEEVEAPQKPQEEQKQPDVSADLFEADFAPELGGLGDGVGDAVVINLSGGPSEVMESDFVFESYELDQAPRAVVKTPPVYPFKAREGGVEGVVQVKILVREDGSVGEVIIMDARPKDVFEEAVLNAVPRWRFEPGVIGGKKVTSWVVTALHFKLS